jgi:uncharacterized protein YukE
MEAQAGRIETLAHQLQEEIRTANDQLQGVEWQGQSQLAFLQLFEETTTQVNRTAELVGSVAATLRAAKDQIVETDEAIGAGIMR